MRAQITAAPLPAHAKGSEKKDGPAIMIRIKQAVIVEGKYDKIKLSSLLDTVIIQTDGFGIFKNKEKMALIRRLAQTRGIVILTDSDSAGFKSAPILAGVCRRIKVIHAYIPGYHRQGEAQKRALAGGKAGRGGDSL